MHWHCMIVRVQRSCQSWISLIATGTAARGSFNIVSPDAKGLLTFNQRYDSFLRGRFLDSLIYLCCFAFVSPLQPGRSQRTQDGAAPSLIAFKHAAVIKHVDTVHADEHIGRTKPYIYGRDGMPDHP